VHLIVTEAGRMVLADEAGAQNNPVIPGKQQSAVIPSERSESRNLAVRTTTGPGRAAESLDPATLWPPDVAAHVAYVPAEKIDAGPASGSFPAAAMVVIPCSMNTLAALAHGLAGNLVQRAAYVALKEGRPLVVVPREMPLTSIDFDNMARLASAGAVVMPAMPGFYHRPRTVADLVDFVVAKVLDRLGIAHELAVRWPGSQ
jgi:4-hydroxy-3-polyprenylbenzoate decarboxylase